MPTYNFPSDIRTTGERFVWVRNLLAGLGFHPKTGKAVSFTLDERKIQLCLGAIALRHGIEKETTIHLRALVMRRELERAHAEITSGGIAPFLPPGAVLPTAPSYAEIVYSITSLV